MKRNKYEIQVDAELDLHGSTSIEAEDALEDFLFEAKKKGWKRVHIIVGKGLHSKNKEPVLPNVVKAKLNSLGHVFSYAKIQYGGEGVLEVIL